jgi:acyl-coenzyme A thioesterase PaaI-like protein
MAPPPDPSDAAVPAWRTFDPGRIIGRGHPAGDFLQAYDWHVIEQRPGYLKLDVHLPQHLKNPRGQLFGGYTPTYVDLVALRTAASARAPGEEPAWLTTLSIRVDFLAPIVTERFVIEGEEIHRKKGTHLVEVRFHAEATESGEMLAFAVVTLRDVPRT